jgi:hypothetical protein
MNIYNQIGITPAHILVSFRGSQSTYDYYKDLSIVMNYRGYGTNQYNDFKNQLCLDFKAQYNQYYVEYGEYPTITMTGHSLGSKLALDIRYKLIKEYKTGMADGLYNNIQFPINVYGFCPVAWYDDNLHDQHDDINNYIQDTSNPTYNIYEELINHTTSFVVENDVVSALWTYANLGYGTTFSYPAVVSTTHEVFSVLTFQQFIEYQNHRLDNFILTSPNQYFMDLPFEPKFHQLGANNENIYYPIDQEYNDLTIINVKAMTDGGSHNKLWAKTDNGVTTLRFNNYEDETPLNHIHTYKWTITPTTGYNIEVGVIGKTIGRHSYLTKYDTAGSQLIQYQITFKPYQEMDIDGIQRATYFILNSNNEYLRMQNGINTRSEIIPNIGIDANWVSGDPSQGDNILRNVYVIDHHGNLAASNVAGAGHMRRIIYDVSESNYTPPIHYINSLAFVYMSGISGNLALGVTGIPGPWPLATDINQLQQLSGGAGSFNNSNANALVHGLVDRTYIAALRTAPGEYFENYDLNHFHCMTTAWDFNTSTQISPFGLPAGDTCRVFHTNFNNTSWASLNPSFVSHTANSGGPNSPCDFFGHGNNSICEFIEIPNGHTIINIPARSLCV